MNRQIDFTNWRKSTHSSSSANCVETPFSTWRKSSYSSGNTGNCVEVASAACAIGVRDSKQHGCGLVLVTGAASWRAFVTAAARSTLR